MPEVISLAPHYPSLFRQFLNDAAMKEAHMTDGIDVVQLSEWAASFNIALNSTYDATGNFDAHRFLTLRDHLDAFSALVHDAAEIVRAAQRDEE